MSAVNRRLTALPAALTVLALCAGHAVADGGGAAAGAPSEDEAAAIAHDCGTEYDCVFRILPEVSHEYAAAVVSVGNGVLNCTNHPIKVDRTVTMTSSTTDNIAGEISGKAGIEGVIDNTTNASASATTNTKTEITHIDHTAPKDKGPNEDIANGSSQAASGTVTGAAQLKLSAKASYELAFKATYSHEWKRSVAESTVVTFLVKDGDELQFGVVNAMTRTIGELHVDALGKLIKNVVVDSPSTVNVNTVVAQTFAVPDKCLSIRPPGRSAAAGGGLVEVPPRPAGAVPDARYRLTADGTWAAFD